MNSPLEPTVIDHDPEAYQRWREAQARRVEAAQPPEGQERTVASRAGEAFSWRGEGHGNGHGHAGGGDDDAPGASFRHDGHQQREGEEYAAGGGGGGGEVLKPEQLRVGVLDRLGLVSDFLRQKSTLRVVMRVDSKFKTKAVAFPTQSGVFLSPRLACYKKGKAYWSVLYCCREVQ